MPLFRTAAACAAAACLLAACSSSGGKDHPSSPPRSTGSGTADTSAPSSPPASASSTAATTASATAALLTAAEVPGGTFTEQPYKPDTTPPPCDAKGSSLDAQVHPAVTVGRDLVQDTPQAFLEEEYKIYADEATAQQAMTAAKAALNCKTGKSYNDDGTSETITISAPDDVTSALGQPADEAYNWSVSSDSITGAAVAVRIKQRLVLFTFAAEAGADTAKLPDISAVVGTAVAKVAASS